MTTSQPTSPTPSTSARPERFVPLPLRRPSRAFSLGCLPRMGGFLLAFGIWLLALSVLVRPEAPTARAQVAAGAALVVIGAALLFTLMRRIRAAGAPPAELALPRGCVLHPGVSVPLRVRQPGPARLARLLVRRPAPVPVPVRIRKWKQSKRS